MFMVLYKVFCSTSGYGVMFRHRSCVGGLLVSLFAGLPPCVGYYHSFS